MPSDLLREVESAVFEISLTARSTRPEQDVTDLLLAWRGGDDHALDRLVPLVQRELHRIAKRAMARERADHTLQPTALVNEVYLKLVGLKGVSWANRAHFFARCADSWSIWHARRGIRSVAAGYPRRVSTMRVTTARDAGTTYIRAEPL